MGRGLVGSVNTRPAASPSQGGIVARCVHGSMFLEYAPSFYPVEQPPRNHTQGPNFCNLHPLLAYQQFLFFVLMRVTSSRVVISAALASIPELN